MRVLSKMRRMLGAAVPYVISLASIVFFLYPIIQMFLTSIKPTRELLWSIWPKVITWDNYKVVLHSEKFRLSVANSLLVSSVATISVVMVGLLAAYALSAFEFKRRENIAFFILSLYILPPIVTIIPVWQMAQTLGLLDSRLFLALTYAFFNLPFTVWLLRNFLMTVPGELREAALVDGCSKMGALFHIVLPIIKPGIAVASIFAFIFSWNEFLFSVVLTETQAVTLPVQIASQVSYFVEWGKLSSMTIISIIPVMVMGILVQRYIVMGLTLGAVKG